MRIEGSVPFEESSGQSASGLYRTPSGWAADSTSARRQSAASATDSTGARRRFSGGGRRTCRARVRCGCQGRASRLKPSGSRLRQSFSTISWPADGTDYRHRNDDLGLRPIVQPVEGEFDRRPRPLPTHFNQARKSLPRRHAEEGERHVQVARRHWPPFDLVERRSHCRCQLRAIGVPGPKGKEEPQGSRAVLNGASALCEGVRPLHGLHESGRPASATAVAW